MVPNIKKAREANKGAYVQKRRVDISKDVETCKKELQSNLKKKYGNVGREVLVPSLYRYAQQVRASLVESGEEREVRIADEMLPISRPKPLSAESKKLISEFTEDENFAHTRGVAAISMYCAILSILKDIS